MIYSTTINNDVVIEFPVNFGTEGIDVTYEDIETAVEIYIEYLASYEGIEVLKDITELCVYTNRDKIYYKFYTEDTCVYAEYDYLEVTKDDKSV